MNVFIIEYIEDIVVKDKKKIIMKRIIMKNVYF